MQRSKLAKVVPIAVRPVHRRDRWRARIQRVEGPSPCPLPGDAGARLHASGGCRHGLARWAAPRPSLHLHVCWSDGDPPRHRDHGSAGDGSCNGGNYCRTPRTKGRARGASHRDCRGRGRAALDCEGSSRARIARLIVHIVRNGASGSRVGTHMFLIAPGEQELACCDGADGETKA